LLCHDPRRWRSFREQKSAHGLRCAESRSASGDSGLPFPHLSVGQSGPSPGTATFADGPKSRTSRQVTDGKRAVSEQPPVEALEAAEVHLVDGLLWDLATKPDGHPHRIHNLGNTGHIRASITRPSCTARLMLPVPSVLLPLLTQRANLAVILTRSMSRAPYRRRSLGYSVSFSLRDKPLRSDGKWIQWT
jgi:hypothetical protein